MTDIVRGACPHGCPDSSSELIAIESGQVRRRGGNSAHLIVRGALCSRRKRYLARVYDSKPSSWLARGFRSRTYDARIDIERSA